MLRPNDELCAGWRAPVPSVAGDYNKGPDVPAGYYFFGKPVYRTALQVRLDSGLNTISIPWGGMTDLVDVWGCERTQVIGTQQGVVHYFGFLNAGTNGATGVRVRIKPDLGVLEIVSGGILEFGGSAESKPFPDADLELVIFWVK